MKLAGAILSISLCATSVRAFAGVSRPAGVRAFDRAVDASAMMTPVSRQFSSQLAATPQEFVQAELDSNKVVVFSKTFCPFCSATKSLLKEKEIDAKVIELDELDDGADVQAALQEMSGQRTVPNVFINGQHLGGNDDTQAAAKSGKLEELIAA